MTHWVSVNDVIGMIGMEELRRGKRLFAMWDDFTSSQYTPRALVTGENKDVARAISSTHNPS